MAFEAGLFSEGTMAVMEQTDEGLPKIRHSPMNGEEECDYRDYGEEACDSLTVVMKMRVEKADPGAINMKRFGIRSCHSQVKSRDQDLDHRFRTREKSLSHKCSIC